MLLYTHIDWFIVWVRKSVFDAYPLHIDKSCGNDMTITRLFLFKLILTDLIKWTNATLQMEHQPTTTMVVLIKNAVCSQITETHCKMHFDLVHWFFPKIFPIKMHIWCQVRNVTCQNKWRFIYMQCCVCVCVFEKPTQYTQNPVTVTNGKVMDSFYVICSSGRCKAKTVSINFYLVHEIEPTPTPGT